MGHGWPQGFAVAILRRVRPDLEREHARILMQDQDKLFDWEAIRAAARPGDIAVTNTDPVFLALASKPAHPTDETRTPRFSAVCRGYWKVSEFSRDVGASSVTTFEVVTLTHQSLVHAASSVRANLQHPHRAQVCASVIPLHWERAKANACLLQNDNASALKSRFDSRKV